MKWVNVKRYFINNELKMSKNTNKLKLLAATGMLMFDFVFDLYQVLNFLRDRNCTSL